MMNNSDYKAAIKHINSFPHNNELMTSKEAKYVINNLLINDSLIVDRRSDKQLTVNGKKYRIRPDEAFYYRDRVFLVEYENNKRPVESISKYHWLFKETEWQNESIAIDLLFIVCNPNLESKYPIRTKSIEILGCDLNRQYPGMFNFSFIKYSDLTGARLEHEVQTILRT